MTATVPTHRLLGMTDEEYDQVRGILGREPADAELAMYSVMWSEHCSYKSSRPHLGRFPSEAPWVVVGPGENAGVIDIGDGWLAALRIESHNHPSFVEPYQGAATGVGGIIRDVFTMGARPIALWNQIRFGRLDDAKNRYLFKGVISGIAGYGNAVGVPTVGGELEFDDAYSGNPLVNVMCLGIMRQDQLVLGTAGAPGSVAVLLGNATGRDGIGGASVLASSSFDDESAEKRPSVQVGDPFEEKKLIEACLELFRRRLVVGIQDLGAAGLSCATSEPAARAGVGIDLDLDSVHVREDGMSAPELLMSESQERMMAFVQPDKVEDVLAVAERWEIDASVVGSVQPGNRLRVRHRGGIVADIPAASLSDGAPLLQRPVERPPDLEERWKSGTTILDPTETFRRLLADPGVGSAEWVYSQFDHMLYLSTVVGPGGDGSLLRIRGTTKGLAASTDGNGFLCSLDPRRGAARLVYEAALNVSILGAMPMAVVDNLNFGNPEKPEVMWQLVETVEGLSQACEELGIPVIGGNVSLYNETDGNDIHPTPVVGLLGVADPMPTEPPRLSGALSGHELWLIGGAPTRNLAGSMAQRVVDGAASGRPEPTDPALGKQVNDFAREAAHRHRMVHDISTGGLAVAVAEACIASNVGVELDHVIDTGQLFAEDPHRFLLSAEPGWAPDPSDLPALRLGVFRPGNIDLGAGITLDLGEARSLYRDAIPTLLA